MNFIIKVNSTPVNPGIRFLLNAVAQNMESAVWNINVAADSLMLIRTDCCMPGSFAKVSDRVSCCES